MSSRRSPRSRRNRLPVTVPVPPKKVRVADACASMTPACSPARARPHARVITRSAAASVHRMEHPTFDLTGQVALVTGASRGIGHDLVLALAAAGATVAAGARSAPDVADLVEQVRAAGGRAVAVELDVTDLAGIEPAVQHLVADLGRIDILVNNAGLGANHDALDVTESDWDAMMDVNLKGLFFVTQAVARTMVPRG